MAKKMEKIMPYIGAIIIQCSFAGMMLISKAAMASGMKFSVLVAYRQILATLTLLPFTFFFPSKESPLTWKALGKLFVVSSFGLTLSMNLNFAGLDYISATFSTALLSLVPTFVFIMALCLRIETLAITEWHGITKVLGTILGLSGALVFTFYKGPSLFSSSNHKTIISIENNRTKEEWIKGSLFSLVAQLTMALWITLQGPLMKQYPGKLRLLILQCGFSSLTATIYGVATERNISSWKLGWNVNLLSVTYTGIVVTGVSYWVQAWVIEKRGPVFSAIFGPLALILAAIFAALFLNETLHWGSVLGGALIVCGLFSFLWAKHQEPQIRVQQEMDILEEEAHLDRIIASVPSIDEQRKQTPQIDP